MKKYFRIIFLLLFVCIVTGCRKTTDDSKKLTFAEWFIKNSNTAQTEIKKIDCPELNENSILAGSSKIFISDNTIYAYNVDKIFSNEKNCKAIGTIEGNKGIAVSRDNAIDADGFLYNDFWQRVDNINYDGPYVKDTFHTGWTEYFKRFELNTDIITSSDIFDVLNYEVLTYQNSELYAYRIDYMNNNPDGESIVYKINIDAIGNEKILKLYGSLVKTDKAYYILNKNTTNKKECEKYADVKCQYEYNLKKEETLTKYYDEIMNISNDYFITYDYELISVADYK